MIMKSPQKTFLFRPVQFSVVIALAALIIPCPVLAQAPRASSAPKVTKLKDVVIYRNEAFYSAFPSIIRRPDGELIVAFRRAPDPRNFGDAGVTHLDPCSQLMLVRSRDQGETWTPDPQLAFAHPFGGMQDPCMLQLDDESILCAGYAWALISESAGQKLKNPVRQGTGFVCLGGVMLRSLDGGKQWSEIPVPPAHGEQYLDPFNKPLPALNRGAMCQGKDGRLYWVTVMSNPYTKLLGTHLMISEDRGQTWNYSCPVAVDDRIEFDETSIHQTPKGDLVAFIRTERFNDHTAIARSTDGGKSFEKWQDAGFRGHPHYALRLPNDYVLLVYGYRHAPFGIRARVLNPECTNWDTAPEIVLRDDGGGGDLGYPWATMISDDQALVVYYFYEQDGPRYIAGTLLKIDANE